VGRGREPKLAKSGNFGAVFIPRIEDLRSSFKYDFQYDSACLNVFVSGVVQPGLPEFGTHLAQKCSARTTRKSA